MNLTQVLDDRLSITYLSCLLQDGPAQSGQAVSIRVRDQSSVDLRFLMAIIVNIKV